MSDMINEILIEQGFEKHHRRRAIIVGRAVVDALASSSSIAQALNRIDELNAPRLVPTSGLFLPRSSRPFLKFSGAPDISDFPIRPLWKDPS